MPDVDGVWPFPGARWWKFDFHTHTPASHDYGKGKSQATHKQITPSDWLLAFMAAELDCIVVTDHNSGEWVDKLKDALDDLEAKQHPEFRRLHLFPGVEISANGGVHILAVLDTDKQTSDVSALLGAVGYKGERGACDVAAEAAPINVIEAIIEAGGIPIPAHVDSRSGIWRVSGSTLAPILDVSGLFACEVVDRFSAKPELYRQRKLTWAEVVGSDSHHPSGADVSRYPGAQYTWVKMAKPSLEGLRLALIDGNGLSIHRSDDPEQFDPWRLPKHMIEAIEIDEARFMGRGDSSVLKFSPWLNALVGGRGTGKSTVVHAMRLAARRADELRRLDQNSPPRMTFEAFNRLPTQRIPTGGLTSDSASRLVLTRDGIRYRLQWHHDGRGSSVEEDTNGGGWVRSEIQSITPERFPIRLFSQGQIAALAGENQQALMQVIDEAGGVADRQRELIVARDTFHATRARIREIDAKLADRDNVVVAKQNVERKLTRFEAEGHDAVLANFRLRQRQRTEVDRQLEVTEAATDRIESVAAEVQPEDIPDGLFADGVGDEEASATISSLAAAVQKASDHLRDAAQTLRTAAASGREALSRGVWNGAVVTARREYEQLVEALRSEGVSDPNQFGRLVQERQRLDTELQRLDSLEGERKRLVGLAQGQRNYLRDKRRAVTAARNQFLEETLVQNRFVRIRCLAYGRDPRVIERSLRAALRVRDERFSNDILLMEGDHPSSGAVALLTTLLPDEPRRRDEIENRIEDLKLGFEDAAAGGDRFGGNLNNYLERECARTPELLDGLLTWYPEDALIVEYSRSGDGSDFRPIEQASAGQRSAAMLAFLLAHGEEPLVLDQPEDDLDNHLIYDLVVQQIRENKTRRQIIVVTHNPNVVVNGDAEMLHALDFRSGQCRVMQSGSLQDEAMREEVCRVMEGGREAFERRYRRLGRGPV